MKNGLMMLGLLMLANLVAAGVMGTLASVLREAAPWTRDEWWPWAIVAFMGIGCSIAFLQGAFQMLARSSSTKRKSP